MPSQLRRAGSLAGRPAGEKARQIGAVSFGRSTLVVGILARSFVVDMPAHLVAMVATFLPQVVSQVKMDNTHTHTQIGEGLGLAGNASPRQCITILIRSMNGMLGPIQGPMQHLTRLWSHIQGTASDGGVGDGGGGATTDQTGPLKGAKFEAFASDTYRTRPVAGNCVGHAARYDTTARYRMCV